MPMSSLDLARRLRAEFVNTYNNGVTIPDQLEACMRLGVASDQREEFYGYHESAPNFERWDRDNPFPVSEIDSKSFSVENHRFAGAVEWHEDDLADLQLPGFEDRARQIANKARLIPLRAFFEILGASASLLKRIPTAPDGAALYAATAGGGDRFGVSGGNLISGSGVATAAAIRTDFWGALHGRLGAFLDPRGEPLLEDELDGEIVVVFGRHLSEVFTEAFKQERTLAIVTQGGNNVGGAAVTNSIREGNLNVRLWPTSRITDSDWSIFVNSPNVPKPIFEQKRRDLRIRMRTENNSDRALETGRHGIYCDLRSGFGVNLPYGTVKINN